MVRWESWNNSTGRQDRELLLRFIEVTQSVNLDLWMPCDLKKIALERAPLKSEEESSWRLRLDHSMDAILTLLSL